ncbi:hypothetical protein HDA41_002262 [Streptomyces caelestis]|uniref:Uncharacterized protein n=1 Tax=Streptomyces caelestis TaxID=36816 RepID=A0A7W9H244_9ACTN|nr:hypothetical protein [Streptomyces caelestis]
MPSSSDTGCAPIADSALRTSVTRHPVHHFRSASVAGPHAASHRLSSSACACAGSGSGCSGAMAQRNWLDVQEPSGRPRTTFPSTPSTFSSRVETVCSPS